MEDYKYILIEFIEENWTEFKIVCQERETDPEDILEALKE